MSLLRGINVGAHNRIPMAELRTALEESDASLANVRTHLQSGNVVTDSLHRTEQGVADAVREVIDARFGLDIPVIVRAPSALADLLAWNPFRDQAHADPKTVQVVFHADPIDASAELEELAAESGDRIEVTGRELAIAYRTSIRDSRLQPARLARILGQDGTARNWRTVAALVELTT